MVEWWKKEGEKIYEVLGGCVARSLEEENPEMAIICAKPLVKLAEVERANYFGYEGRYNYNSAIELSKKAVKLAEKEGVPFFMKDDLVEIKKTIKDLGFE